KWNPGDRFGYPVDAGVGCFMDADAAEMLIADHKQATERWLSVGDVHADCQGPLEKRLFDDTMLAGDRRSRNPAQFEDYCNTLLDEERMLNVIAFGSGWGDGGGESYFGFDEGNNPVCLVTYFELFDPDIWDRLQRTKPK